jgi:hypothetical protein
VTFRQINHRFIVPGAQILMIFGIVALCQPWVEVLHRYGVTIILIGLVSFMVATKIPAPPPTDEDAA